VRRFAFVMDQQVGLRTQALNYERALGGMPPDDPLATTATFVPVRYAATDSLLTRLPILPSGIRGTLRGIHEIRTALGDARSIRARFDGVLWATWAAKSVLDLVRAAPAALVMDMSPLQMEAMGDLYGYSSARARLFRGSKRRATDRLYAEAAYLFPWSSFVAESLCADYGVPAAKIKILSPGTDLHLFQPDPSARADDGVVRILFVGGDFQRKGGDLLLAWAAARREVGPPIEIHVVTRDDIPATPGVVVHHGVSNNSPELVRLYQTSDLFVLPTRADCYSLVAMEAMACALPVVISRLGGIPDIVADGETGFLIESGDAGALAERLDVLVADAGLRRTMGETGRRRAGDRFDAAKNLRRLLCTVYGCAIEEEAG
jgi:glycosyltransferase involved in cell wall biosynthesis